jgi:hypothetical protein
MALRHMTTTPRPSASQRRLHLLSHLEPGGRVQACHVTHGTRTDGLIGAAGEYYVAAELSRRGWLATVTVKNAPGTDVLAQRADTGRMFAVQTKTASGYEVAPSALRERRLGTVWALTVPVLATPNDRNPPNKRVSFIGAPRFELGTSSPPD